MFCCTLVNIVTPLLTYVKVIDAIVVLVFVTEVRHTFDGDDRVRVVQIIRRDGAYLEIEGTQSGGFQKMCGLMSSTLLRPICAITRSISVWKISNAR